MRTRSPQHFRKGPFRKSSARFSGIHGANHFNLHILFHRKHAKFASTKRVFWTLNAPMRFRPELRPGPNWGALRISPAVFEGPAGTEGERREMGREGKGKGKSVERKTVWEWVPNSWWWTDGCECNWSIAQGQPSNCYAVTNLYFTSCTKYKK